MRVSFVTFLAFLAVATLPNTGAKHLTSGTGLTIIVRERAPRYKGSRGLVVPPDDGTHAVAVSLPSEDSEECSANSRRLLDKSASCCSFTEPCCSLLMCAKNSDIYAWGVLKKDKCEYTCPVETTNNLGKDDDDDDGGSGTGLTIIVRERAPRYKGSRGLVVPPDSDYPYEVPSLPYEECTAGESNGDSVDSGSSCCTDLEPCCNLLKCAEKYDFYASGVFDKKTEECVYECPASDAKASDDKDSEQNSRSKSSRSELAVGGAGMAIVGIFFMRRRKLALQKKAVENPEDVDAVDAVDQTEV